MSGSLKDILAGLMGSREGVLPSIQSFPPLDLDQIARELKLNSRAEEAGKRELTRATALWRI